jgi:hypothetical protein
MKEYNNGFEIADRYDIVISLFLGLVMVGLLAAGVPLWVVPIIMFITCVIVFIRHFEETMGPMGPAEPPGPDRETLQERQSTGPATSV